MNNMSAYCGLVDAKIRASDKDLPVKQIFNLLPVDPSPQNSTVEAKLISNKIFFCIFLDPLGGWPFPASRRPCP